MFQNIEGILETRTGYTGGTTENPSYLLVGKGDTGHAEALELAYNANVVDYKSLVKHFFETHKFWVDRTAKGGKYRSAVFYENEEERQIVEQVIEDLKAQDYDVFTTIEPFTHFWEAEQRHQKYCDRTGLVPKRERMVIFE
ncbi:MAG: peptide-methionine (S)-S-oxide reductase [Bacteroidota bacterium]